MQVAWLRGVDAPVVSDAVTRLLRDKGAILDAHTATQVEFEGWEIDRDKRAGSPTFERGGVVTLVQPTGEREVEVRLRVRARIPSRIFWTTLGVELAIGLLFFVLFPAASLWVLVGAALWLAFVVVGLFYVATWRTSWAAERALLAEILEAARPLAEGVVTREDRTRAEAEETVEAELLQRKVREA